MRPTLDDLVYLAGHNGGSTEAEALEEIDAWKGDLALTGLFEIDCEDDEARDILAFLAPRMKTKKTRTYFFGNALLAALSHPELVKTRRAVLDLAVAWGVDIQNKRTVDGGSMLAAAASFGRTDMVSDLLAMGISPEGRKPGEALDMLFSYGDDEERYIECARLLLEAGASVDKEHLREAKGALGETLRAALEKRQMAADKDIKPGKDKGGKKRGGL